MFFFLSADYLFFKSPAYQYQRKGTDAVAEVHPDEIDSSCFKGYSPNITRSGQSRDQKSVESSLSMLLNVVDTERNETGNNIF